MLNKLYNIVESRHFLWLSGLAAVSLFYLIIDLTPKKAIDEIFAFQLSFTPVRFSQILEGWGESVISGFRQWFWLDYIYPVAYGGFLFSLTIHLWPKKSYQPSLIRHVVLTLPLLAMGLDVIENCLQFSLLLSYPSIPAWQVWWGSLAALIKWLCVGLLLMSLIVVSGLNLIRWRRQQVNEG